MFENGNSVYLLHTLRRSVISRCLKFILRVLFLVGDYGAAACVWWMRAACDDAAAGSCFTLVDY